MATMTSLSDAVRKMTADHAKAHGGSDPHWMERAFAKHPGALTKTAKKAGQSTMGFAESHYHASGKVGQRSRAAVNAVRARHTKRGG